MRNAKFENPSPRSKSTAPVNFCAYWKGMWIGDYPSKFAIDGETRTAEEHLAHAYPGKELEKNGGKAFHLDEFVWLHELINAPAKSEVSRRLVVGIFPIFL